jgi:hypothetical protein
MSTRARRRYEYVQRGLETIALSGRVEPADHDHMREVLSRFRSALTADLESRRKRSVVHTLTDVSHDHRIRDDLEVWHRELLSRHGQSPPDRDSRARAAAVLGHSPWQFLAIAVCAVGAFLVMQLTSGPEDRDAAVVTLAAALIAAAGVSLGHRRGRRDRLYRAVPRWGGHRALAIYAGLILAVAAVAAWVHLVWPDGRAVTEDGLAALCVAVLGVVGVVAVNELALRSGTHAVVGLVLLAGAVLGGVVTLIVTPEPDSAEIGVSYAVAAAGAGATLLGHTAGRAPSRAATPGGSDDGHSRS